MAQEQKRRIVVFGGSFDPIHIGHTALASAVLQNELADEVWFMVSPMNPHKSGNKLTCEQVRLRMVQLAIDGEKRFKACDFEFSLPRPSYTLHTLQALEKAYPDCSFSLLIGADNWEKFDRWYCGDKILEGYPIIVYPRGKEERPQLPPTVKWLLSPLYDISSTEIRSMVARGEDFSSYLRPEVADYIKVNNLYKEI